MTRPVPVLPALAVTSAAVWAVLLMARGRYWRTDVVLSDGLAEPVPWPEVAVVVPARDEADVLPATLPTVLGQDYPGRWRVVLVDDDSDDGTADVARRLAGGRDHLDVVAADPRPPSWVGKVWAQQCGLQHLAGDPPRWVLLTDADISHPADSLRRLVLEAEGRDLDLVSLMARLRVGTRWERLLVPAFVHFFAQLYPFAWVADPRRGTAAAAGGCVLVRYDVLAGDGLLEQVRDALIDDVALGRAAKRAGRRIWLGLSREVASERPYPHLADLWAMVARSADTQLRHDPRLLAGAVAGIVVTHLVPPVATVVGAAGVVQGLRRGGGLAAPVVGAGAGALATTAMTATYRPMVRFLGLPGRWAATLPAAALLYLGMTLDSALRHRLGRGATWKGRAHRSGGA